MIARQDELIEDFDLFDDWEERYSYLIDMGKKLPNMTEGEKAENNVVKGCVSKVWMILTVNDGVIHIKADSDAHIVRGLIAILLRIYDEVRISDLKDIDMDDIFSRLGLDKHLSPNRRNGFFSIVDKINQLSKQ